MKFEMFIGYKNVRDNVGDAVYEFEVYILKDGIACLRLTDRIDFGNFGFTRKSSRVEKISMYMGIGYFLDYMKTSAYFLEEGIDLFIHVKTKGLFNRITKGSGSLEDCLIMRKLMERVADVFEKGCNVQFKYKKDNVKKWLDYSKGFISEFTVLDEKDRWFSLVTITCSVDMRQMKLDERVDLIVGESYKNRRKYYVIDQVGVPLSLGIFHAVMD